MIESGVAYTNTVIKDSHFLQCCASLPFLLAITNSILRVAFNLALKTSKDGFVLSRLDL